MNSHFSLWGLCASLQTLLHRGLETIGIGHKRKTGAAFGHQPKLLCLQAIWEEKHFSSWAAEAQCHDQEGSFKAPSTGNFSSHQEPKEYVDHGSGLDILDILATNAPQLG